MHPLDSVTIEARDFKCFGREGSGSIEIGPISIIIGKNNSGKSTVLDIIEGCCRRFGSGLTHSRAMAQVSDIEYTAPLDGNKLDQIFGQGRMSRLAGKIARFTIKGDGTGSLITLDSELPSGTFHQLKNMLEACLYNPLHNMMFLRVAAERSVLPEPSVRPDPHPTGRGITNLVRHFITNDSQPSNAVEVDLLSSLNQIYNGDAHFTSITCQENDEKNHWEIFLGEEEKGLIRLSESGSSLQSIFIILAYLELVPRIRDVAWDKLIIAIEEPENNLHPALFRRLTEYLASMREAKGFRLILTTHSPVCIDWGARRDDAGILHVMKRDGKSRVTSVLNHGDRAGILNDLDVRGSDILQANGVIWVEGPTDRIYLRKWISLVSDGQLSETAHFTFMYYGGRVLSHFSGLPAGETADLLSMLSLNRNCAIVIDSDRKPGSGARRPNRRINDTKRRLIEEVDALGGFSWVTQGREIENYVPNRVWEDVVGQPLKIRDEFVDIPQLPAVRRKFPRKVPLAYAASDLITLNDITDHLDLYSRVKTLVTHIEAWNSLR